jgi:type I restriction enzyme S subunit
MKRIADVSKILSGGTPRKNIPEHWGGTIPWFSAANMHEKYLEKSDINLTEEGLKSGSRIAPKGATLLLVRGSGLFNRIPICFAKAAIAFNQDVKAFVPDQHTDPLFFHYWFESMRPVLSENLGVTGIGAGKFDTDFLLELPFPDLPRSDQEEIGRVAALCDEKIELNRRMAATLEEMARALYQSWFVNFDPVKAKAEGLAPAFIDEATAALFPDRFGDDELPDGWNFGKLGDVAITPRNGVKPEQIDPDTPYIGLEHMPRRSIALFDWGTAADISSQKSLMSKGDFLFGKLRPYFHKVGIVPIDGICSTDIVVVRPKSPDWASFVLAVISSDEFVEHTNSGSSGTRMPRTSWGEMARYEVVLPNPEVATRFEEITKPWRDRIVEIAHENRTLSALRDTLLPKLMSGELRVGEAREQVEDAA